MTIDTKALRARAVTACQLDQTNITVDVSELRPLLDAADERDVLRVEVARLREDAARYRWLRDPHKCYWISVQSQPHGEEVFDGGGGSCSDGLDAAIDAALTGATK